MPYVSGSYNFKTIFYEIFKLTLLKINEISYSIYYSLIKPRKNFEVKNFEYLAFRYLFPFSINYLDFILNICLNQRLEEKFAKKVWYIKIRLKIKTILYCTIDSISQDISDEFKEENLKVKIEFFTLTKNGGDIHELVKEALKIYKPAGIVFKNTPKSEKNIPHIIFSKSDMYFSATRSEEVRFWNKDTSEVDIETSLGWYLGKNKKGRDKFQHFLAWKKDLDFDEKFSIRPHMIYDTWKAFKFKDREEFLGFYLKSYLILKFAGPEFFALRGLNTKELPMEDYVELNENNPVFESEFWINVKTLSNKDFYRFGKKDLDVGHKFLFEKLWKKEHKNLLPYKEYTDERF